mgnify:CR=1 FL=1
MSDIPLIRDGGRVIAAVDASAHARGVAALAAWAAQRLGVPLELLHAIERDATRPPADFSGSLSLGSQETLLAELAAHTDAPVLLHGAVANGVDVYRRAGVPIDWAASTNSRSFSASTSPLLQVEGEDDGVPCEGATASLIGA